jgi:voltage-gated potassium channel
MFLRPRGTHGNPLRRLRYALLALVLVLMAGTAGFMALTGAEPIDALYFTVITVTTVGYGETIPVESDADKLFTVGLILSAVLVTAWAVSSAAELIFAEFFWTYVGRQRMQRRIDKMSNHTIICGYGRMGHRVAEELSAEDEPWVTIDADEGIVGDLQLNNGLGVVGDATLDDSLLRAGIERAKALIAVTRGDAINIVIILSARALNPDVMVAARAETEDARLKMKRAGANYVLQHHGTAAMHLALSVTHPIVEEVLNRLIPRHGDLDLGQLVIGPDSPLVGRTLASLDARRHGALIVAIWHAESVSVPPKPDLPLEVGDTLIVIGPVGTLQALRRETRGGVWTKA